ncbi:MAG: SIMPL domain-containing protein [Acidimicrobiales bacterium]
MRTQLTPLALIAVASFAVGCGGSSPAAVGTSSSSARASDVGSTPAGITVEATGHGKGVPDLLSVSLNVHSEGGNAQDTLGVNNEQAQRVLDTAKTAGVADDDVQTTNVSVAPRYDNPSSGVAPRIVGYSADESFDVRLRDTASAGTTIDQLSAIGDRVQILGVRFSIDDDTNVLASARDEAVARAKTKAEQLAKAAGLSLGAVRAITEVVPNASAYDNGFSRGAAAGATSSAVPLAPGSQERSITVRVVFDLGS